FCRSHGKWASHKSCRSDLTTDELGPVMDCSSLADRYVRFLTPGGGGALVALDAVLGFVNSAKRGCFDATDGLRHRLPAAAPAFIGACSNGPAGGRPMSTVERVGTRQLRPLDIEFLRGRAAYLDDIEMPAALHVAFVRSIEAHARIRRIDTAAAAA